MSDVADAIRYQHEHFDGSGYPEGLSGEQIPLASRIIQVAQVYDAITSPRAFQEASDHELALDKLRNGAGKQFDPDVVRALDQLKHLAILRRTIARDEAFENLALTRAVADQSLAGILTEVEKNPLLAAQILRKVNRDGVQSGEVVDLNATCMRLGEEDMRWLLNKDISSGSPDFGLDRLREHSVFCANVAQRLAEQTGIIDAKTAYAMGLLHDVGEALLISLFPKEMENIVWLSEDERVEQEIAVFGVDHGQVGQWILESCGVAPSLSAAVQSYQDAGRINGPAALLLHVADAIAYAKDPSEVKGLDAFGSDLLATLQLTRDDVERIRAEVTDATESRYAVVV